MSRSKTRRGGSEHDILDRMKHENAKLKRENARLRRIVDRIDLQAYDNLRDFVNKQAKEDRAMDSKTRRDRLQEKWKCHECGKGILKPYVFDIKGNFKYYRSCTTCSHRTQMKPLTDDVDLELKDEEE